MTFVRPKARILERTITSGNGPYALAGAVDGSYNAFSAFMADGDSTYVSVVEPGVAFWAGIATYASAANTITLTTVEETKGTFGAGTKEIMSGALASTSMFREDIAGAIVTGGTSTAYTAASYRKYDTLTRLDGNIIAFTPHTTNGQTVTLNVDGLGNKPLRTAPATELLSGTIIQGTPYLAVYNHTDDAFYLHGFFGNPYNIPLGAGMDYWLPTAPNSSFVFPIGQAISRTAYSSLFGAMGTTYGSGDGSTTFNLPDKTGRVSAMHEASATRLTSTYFGGNSTVLGAVGGAESQTLTLGQLPTGITSTNSGITLTNGAPAVSVATGTPAGGFSNGIQGSVGVSSNPVGSASVATNVSVASQGSSMSNNTSGNPHRTVQPTIICNYILRII